MVESGKLQVSAAAAASFLRVMSSAHTHTRSYGENSVFSDTRRLSISHTNTSWIYPEYIYTDFVRCNCILLFIESFARCW